MRTAKHFGADEGGATAMMFALAIVPLVGLIGGAVDYGRATAARAQLQRAVDATTLALVRQSSQLSDTQLAARGSEIFHGLLAGEREILAGEPTITRDRRTIHVSASGRVRTFFMGLVDHDEVTVASDSKAAWGDKRIELALVLDNTGSMARANKMPELKKAADALLTILQNAPNARENIRVSVVPFDTQVRLPTTNSNQSWLKVLKASEVLGGKERPQGNEWKRGAWVKPLDGPTDLAARNAWAGYVSERDLYRRDPVTGQTVEVRMNVKDEPAETGKPETLYPMVRNEEGAHLPFVHPLTNQLGPGTLRSAIGAMQPRGCTDITLGAMWGLETLSRSEPFTEAAPFGTPDVEKVMILLTDGWNTRDAFRSVCGHAEGDAVLDRRTGAACEVVKSRGVTVFSIKVIEGSDNLLRGCASHPTKDDHAFYMDGKPLYFPVTDASQLTGVFEKIASQIVGTRLTH